MEAGHGKGRCDPIGLTAIHKAAQKVKNDKAVIQDAKDFFSWVKKSEKISAIKFYFLYTVDCSNAAAFLTSKMKLHSSSTY